MLPGMGDLKDRIAGIDERDVDHIEAIIHSMTPASARTQDHRRLPTLPDRQGSRGGSLRGQHPHQSLLRGPQDDELAGNGLDARGPGMGGLTGPRRQPARSQKKKGGQGVSGNPAKRNAAQQPAAAVDPAAAFGGDFDQAALEKAMADFQLPPELRSRFGK